MEFIKIAAQPRQATTKSGNKQVRRAGGLPAIVYGKGRDNEALSVNAKEFGQHVGKGGRLFTLDFGGRTELTLLKDLQYDTFGVILVHADFTRVSEQDRIKVNIPLRLTHVNKVDLGGGTLMVDMHTVAIEAPVTAIPDEILLDVTDLTLVHPKSARDLVLPEGVTLACHEGDSVVHIALQKAVVEAPAEAAAEGAEGAEGEAKPAAEGEAKPAAEAEGKPKGKGKGKDD